MLRRVLFCVATALGATLAHAPAASAEPICVYVGVTHPVNRPPVGDCNHTYPGDTACVTHKESLEPMIGVVVFVCGPWTHGEPPLT